MTTEENKCVEVCGDGIFLRLTSECDDHNTEDGDGCSSTCEVEYGYKCEDGTKCVEVIPPTLLFAKVDEPNVITLEFDEEVFVSSDGKNKHIL